MNNKFLLCIILSITLVYSVAAKTNSALDTEKQNSEKNIASKKNNYDLKLRDTTKFSVGNMSISVIENGKDILIRRNKKNLTWEHNESSEIHKKHIRSFYPHWSGLGLSMNGYLNSNQEMSLPEGAEFLDLNTNKSLQFDLNIWQLGINIAKEKIGLVTGVGFRWNNYRFSNSNNVLYKNDGKIDYYTDTISNFVKNKLGVTYLTVPILIEFKLPKYLYFSAGIEGAVKLGAKIKTKSNNGDKNKKRDDFYINPFTYNLTARIGYDNFGLYGTYSMVPLFKKERGPELYPFALGVTFNF